MPSSFDPIIDDHATTLILGTLPGAMSHEKGEYYAKPQNQFWRIVFSIYGEPLTGNYDEKCSFLK